MTYTLDPLPRTATPDDYTRIHFDPSHLAQNDKKIVGLLACQRDPLLRSLTTRLVSAKPAQITPPPKAKSGKKKAPQPQPASEGGNEAKGQLWEVELSDTVIFPEGGGQPCDTGRLVLTDPNGGEKKFVVESCLRRKLDSVHLVRVPEGQEGAFDEVEGKEVRVELDWERRTDHMTIHTAQHLLSAILDVEPYKLPTLSWSMHAHPSLETPYVELSRALTPAEADDVERRCQALIDEGRKVWVDVTVQEEGFERVNAANGERESRGLPGDYAGGVIRHINIENTDRNACCGTQCPDLSMISAIHVLPPTTSSNSNTKLLFTAGPRASRFLKAASRTLTAAAQTVGTSRYDLVERLEKFDQQRREGMDSVKGLRGELVKLVTEKAVQEGKGGQGIVWVSREERATNDFEFLGLVATGYLQSPELASTTVTEGDKATAEAATHPLPLTLPLAILTSSIPGAQTLLLVQSPDQELAKTVNENLKKAFDGRVKGGGAKGRYMSKIDGKWGKAEAAFVQRVVDEVRAGRT